MEALCKKCQILFSMKNKKNITNFLSAELTQTVVKVNAFLQEFWTTGTLF